MAVQTFPLSVASFMAILPVKSMMFDAPSQVETSQTGAGEFYTAELSPALWRGQVNLGLMTSLEHDSVQLMLDLLRPAGRTFYAYDTRRPGPRLDPLGTILGASVPNLQSVPTTREIALQGLPAGYVLSRGDYLAYDYLGKRALHRIVPATVAASGGGITPAFEVIPFVEPGPTIGTAVILIKAACKAMILPGSINSGITWHSHTEGVAFEFQQTLG